MLTTHTMRGVRYVRTFVTAGGRLLPRSADVVCREKWSEMMSFLTRDSQNARTMARWVTDIWPTTVTPLAPTGSALPFVTRTATEADFMRILSLLIYAAHAGSYEHVYLLFSALESSAQARIIRSLVDELCRRRMTATALGLLASALSACAHASYPLEYKSAIDTAVEAAVKSLASEQLLLDFLTAIDAPPPFRFSRRTSELLATSVSERQRHRLLFELSRLRQPMFSRAYVPVILSMCCTQGDLIFLVDLARTHVQDCRSPNRWRPFAFPPEVYPEIIDNLIRIERPYDAIFFYQQLAETRPLSIYWFKVLADCAVRLRRIDIAREVCRGAVARLRDKPTSREVDLVSLMTYTVLFYAHKFAGQIDDAWRTLIKIADRKLPLDTTTVSQYLDMVAASYEPARVINAYVTLFGSYPLADLGLDNYISDDRPDGPDSDFYETEQRLPQQQLTATSLAILLRFFITHTMYMPHLLMLEQNIKAFVSGGGLEKLGPYDPECPIAMAKKNSDIKAFKKIVRICIQKQKRHLKETVAQIDLDH
ncbi:hypothetical protein V1525DRAFT_399591 [Lipomyces kononenkoae]|uniref:Uncharacterized protein n=1 Tax=Lipomyces kononenkoae TaxID=34357 RepID=A0ACC3T509_LIPKO